MGDSSVVLIMGPLKYTKTTSKATKATKKIDRSRGILRCSVLCVFKMVAEQSRRKCLSDES
jgi:hypothetical protein